MASRWAPQQTRFGAALNGAGGRGKSLADSRWAPQGATMDLKPKKVNISILFPCFYISAFLFADKIEQALARVVCCCHRPSSAVNNV